MNHDESHLLDRGSSKKGDCGKKLNLAEMFKGYVEPPKNPHVGQLEISPLFDSGPPKFRGKY